MTEVMFCTNPQVVVKETAGVWARWSAGAPKAVSQGLSSKETKVLWEKKEGFFVVK